MITVYSALKQTQEATELALTNAGWIDGLTLDKAEIEITEEPLFWFMKVTTKEASDKQLYATYEISDLSSISHGDGETSVRRSRVELNIYSRSRNIDELLEATNNSFIAIFKNFELRQIVYDTSLQVYNYSFIASANITELVVEE